MTTERKPLRVLAWNVLFLLAGVLLLELVFGNWLRNDPLRPLNLTRNGTWRTYANIATIPPNQRNVLYSRDKWGLRGDFGTPDRIDILTMGGSTTDQRYITDGKTWQDILAREFRRDGRDMRVANSGLSGRTTFGHIREFERWFPQVPGLKPRYILFFVGINDMFFDIPNTRWDRIEQANPWYWKQIVKDNSALYYVYRTIIGAWLARRHDLTHTSIDYPRARWTDKPIGSDYARLLAPRLRDYRARLVRLVELTQAMEATPIFVTQMRGDARRDNGQLVGVVHTRVRVMGPWQDRRLGLLDRQKVNGVDLYQILALFNATTLDVCRSAKGVCIDLASELDFEIGDFYDHVHNTVSGADKIGRYLHQRLKDVIQPRP